jgi:DNA polymerase III subunit gamma/tau
MMRSMSWYRTYRPQTVAGLHIIPVRDAFQRILDSGSFSHAYLLTGPKGTGKTSAARILAKVLNCETNRDAIEKKGKKQTLKEPCNTCSSCLAITQGTSMCVVEMDAASNRGIDDIRSLTERIGLSPGDGVVSVYIIDEVHMLTTEAFNALLKALEEPPAHVVFVLATTELQKLPATVTSRCQVVTYRKATPEEIGNALTAIAKSESLTLEDGVTLRLSSYADGSFRDAVKLLEQLGAGKKKIGMEDVDTLLGKSLIERAEELIRFLATSNLQEVAKFFSTAEETSLDLIQLQKQVLLSLHQRLIKAEMNNPHTTTYIRLIKHVSVPSTSVGSIPGLPFEIACLEWCVDNAKQTSPSVGPPQAEPPKRKEERKYEDPKPSPKSVSPLEPTQSVEPPAIDTTPVDVPNDISVVSIDANAPAIEFTAVMGKWNQLLRSVRQKNSSIEALLRSTRPMETEKNTLKLEVFYQFHKEQLETIRNRTAIEEVLSELIGSPVRVSFILGKKAVQGAKSPDYNISGAVEDAKLVKAAEEAFL